MKFNKTKYKILHMDRGNPTYKYRMCGERIESRPEEKSLGVLVDETLNMVQKCACAAQKANCIQGCIKEAWPSDQGRDFCLFAQVRPYLESCVQPQCPEHRKDMDLLEWVQRRVTESIRGKAVRVAGVEPGEDKALGRPHFNLPVPEGGLQERWRGTSYKGL